MALWGRKPAEPPAGPANGNGTRTGIEQQQEWRSASWAGQNNGRVEPMSALPPTPLEHEEDLVLTADMVEEAPPPAPQATAVPVQFEPEPVAAPAPMVAAPEPAPVAVPDHMVVAAEPAPPAPVLQAAPVPVAPEPVERTDDTGRSQFFAGRGVKIKAEVSGCDVFRVEGDFDGQVTARRMFISPTGVFKGTGTVEEAEVEGRVEGTLMVTGVLVLKATGRVTGSISYGQIEIERGGHLQGDIAPKAGNAPAAAASSPTPRAVAVPPPVRMSTPKPSILMAPATPEPTLASPPAPRKPILPPLSFGAKRNAPPN